MKMRLLDLFCGAGGAAMGYHRAGFEVVGVDINPQPRFPFEFHQSDALSWPLNGFHVIHASPPCQAHTNASNRWRGKGTKADSHLDLIGQTREKLQSWGKAWIIENVPGATLTSSHVCLTGRPFGLSVHRPRLFETSLPLKGRSGKPPKEAIGVYGRSHDGRRLNNNTEQRCASSLSQARMAMGIDWMNWRELCEAVPPAYTEYLGRQIMQYLMSVQEIRNG